MFNYRSEKSLEIITDYFHLYYDKKEFSAIGLSAHVFGNATVDRSLWRYGLSLDADEWSLGGTARTLDKANGRVEVGQAVIARNGYSDLDDSDSMLFTDDGWVAGRRAKPENA